jgi:hypothetical protein
MIKAGGECLAAVPGVRVPRRGGLRAAWRGGRPGPAALPGPRAAVVCGVKGSPQGCRAQDDGTPWQDYAGSIGHLMRGMTVSTCNAAEREAGMFEAGDIREWRGYDVVDFEGHKIGELEAVYVDTSTDLPAFGTVKVGMPTRHRLVFVPLAQATVGPGYLKVAHDRKQVRDSPSISTDGELPAADEEAVFRHYGLTYQPGASGERQLARR